MLRRLATIIATLTLAACSDGFTSPTGPTLSKNFGDAVTVPLTFGDSLAVPQGGNLSCHGMEQFLSSEKLAKIPGCRQ